MSEFISPPSSGIEEVSCNLCGKKDGIIKFRRFGYTIVECPECSLWWVNPRITQEAAKEIYASRYFEIRKVREEGDDPIVESFKKENSRRRLAGVGKFVSSGRILDIGCGEGLFLCEARDKGWEVNGVELSPQASSMALEALPGKIFQGTLKQANFPDESFDVVTMFDVIEHVYDPVAELKEVRRVLKPGGILYILTPDCGSFYAKILGQYWFEIKPKEHIYYFSGKTLPLLFQNAGFTTLEIAASGKVLTFKYIANILEKENPFFGKMLRALTAWTPFYNMPISFGKGFVTAVGKRI